MDKPTININGVDHEIKILKGKDWRIVGEFIDKKMSFSDKNFIEEQADFISNFFDGVSADEVLDLPLEEIVPLSIKIRNFVIAKITEKLKAIEKNADSGVKDTPTL